MLRDLMEWEFADTLTVGEVKTMLGEAIVAEQLAKATKRVAPKAASKPKAAAK